MARRIVEFMSYVQIAKPLHGRCSEPRLSNEIRGFFYDEVGSDTV